MASVDDITDVEFHVEVVPPEAGPVTAAFTQMGGAATDASASFDTFRQASINLGDAVNKSAGGAQVVDASWKRLMASIDPYTAQVGRLQAQQAQLNRLHDQGRGSAEDYARATTLLAGQIHSAEQAAVRFNESEGRLNLTHGQSNFLLRTLGREAVGAVSALASGAPVMSVLADRAGQMAYEMTLSRHGIELVREAFGALISPMGLATVGLAGMAAAVAVLASRYIEMQAQSKDIQRIIIGTGQAATTSVSQIEGYSASLRGMGVAAKEAKEIAADLARQYALTADQRSSIASITPGISAITGQKDIETEKQISEAVLGHKDAIDKLNEALNLLTPGQYAAVRAMLAHNQAADAGEIMLRALQERNEQLRKNGLEPTVNVIQAMTEAWYAFVDSINNTTFIHAQVEALTAVFRRLAEALGSVSMEKLTADLLDTQKQMKETAAQGQRGIIAATPEPGSIDFGLQSSITEAPGLDALKSKEADLQRQIDVLKKGGLTGSQYVSEQELSAMSKRQQAEAGTVRPGAAAPDQAVQKRLQDEVDAAAKGSKAQQEKELKESTERMKTALKGLDAELANGTLSQKQYAAASAQLKAGIEGNDEKLKGHTKTVKEHRDAVQSLLEKTNLQADQNLATAAAILRQDGSVNQLTASYKAQEQATGQTFKTDAQKQAAIEAQTAANLRLVDSENQKQMAQQVVNNQNQTDIINFQTEAIGQNADETERSVEAMKIRQDLVAKGIPLESEMAQKVIGTADALVQARQANREAAASFSELSGFVDRTMDDIAQAITNAFMSGQGAAVNFGNIVKSVIASIVQEFIKLALINPLKMALTGEFQPTLGSVAGAWGSLGGGGGMGMAGGGAAVALGGLTGSQLWNAGTADFQAPSGQEGGGGSPFGANNLLTIAGLAQQARGGGMFSNLWRGISPNFGNAGIFSPGGIGGNWGGVTSFMQQGLFGTSLSEAAIAANTPANVLAMGGGLEAPLSTGIQPATGILGGASIGGLATSVLGGFGLGSMAGGLLQRSLGKTGPGPMIGAGGGALAGAAIGSIIPGIGTVIGGLIGGLLGGGGGGLIGPKPPSPYQASFLGYDTSTGRVISNPALAGNQLMPSNFQEIENQKNAFNQQMGSLGIRISGTAGLTNVGSGAGPGALGFFGQSKAGNMPASLNDIMGNLRFGAASDAGMSAQTIEVMNRALDRSFSSFDELGKKVTEVRTFVEQTVPTFRRLADGSSSLNDALIKIDEQYNPAIQTAKDLGYAEQELTDARAAAIQKAKDAVTYALSDQQAQYAARYASAQATLSNDPQQGIAAVMQAFDLKASEELKQESDYLASIYGDSYKQTQTYADQMAGLERALGAERLVTLKSANDQIAAADKQAADQRAQQMEQARATGSQMISQITEYARGLQFNSATTPLSPRSQLDAAQRQFQAVAGASAAGDANSISKLTSYSDTLLGAARQVYGSGEGYAQIFRQVTEALAKVGEVNPDVLTASIYALEVRTQTTTLVQAIADLKAEVAGLRAQVASNGAMPSRLAA